MEHILIEPGQYIPKKNINSESAEYVRVLGISPNKDNYYITDNGEMSAHTLKNDYIRVDRTIKTDIELAKEAKRAALFADFEPIDGEKTQPQKPQSQVQNQPRPETPQNFNTEEQKINNFVKENTVTENQAPHNYKQEIPPIIQKPQRSELDIIFDKVKISELLKNNPNYQVKDNSLLLTIELPIHHDLTKVKNLMEMFEYQPSAVSLTLLDAVIKNPEELHTIFLLAMADALEKYGKEEEKVEIHGSDNISEGLANMLNRRKAEVQAKHYTKADDEHKWAGESIDVKFDANWQSEEKPDTELEEGLSSIKDYIKNMGKK